MAAVTRIYRVTQATAETVGVKERLIRAANVAQAIKHVVKPMFTAEVATQDDIVRLAKTHAVEDASE